jgi:hypothetical protein
MASQTLFFVLSSGHLCSDWRGIPLFQIQFEGALDHADVWPQNGQASRPNVLTRPHFLQVTWPGCGADMGPGGGRGRGLGSGMITPTRQVMMPVTKSAPPPMNTGKTLAHAKMLPDRIVSRQELAAAATRTGPSTTIITPRMKISDLNLSRNPWEAISCRVIRRQLTGYLILCYCCEELCDTYRKKSSALSLVRGQWMTSVQIRKA